MSEADWAFSIFALLAVGSAVISRQWKALIWVFAITVSYLNADMAWRSNLGSIEAATLTLIGDGTVCLLVFFLWRQRWELWIWRLYQAAVAVSLIYIVTLLASHGAIRWHNAYSYTQEAINALALLGLFVSGMIQWVGTLDHGPLVRFGRHLHPLVRALHRNRTALPFTHRAR